MSKALDGDSLGGPGGGGCRLLDGNYMHILGGKNQNFRKDCVSTPVYYSFIEAHVETKPRAVVKTRPNSDQEGS